MREQPPRFKIWNPTTEVDVARELEDVAEVSTEVRRHPDPSAPPDERYIWVSIRKKALWNELVDPITLGPRQRKS